MVDLSRSGRQFRITTNRVRTDHEVSLNICLVGLWPPFHGECVAWSVEQWDRRRRASWRVHSTPSSLLDANPVFNALSWVRSHKLPKMMQCFIVTIQRRWKTHDSSLLPHHFEHRPRIVNTVKKRCRGAKSRIANSRKRNNPSCLHAISQRAIFIRCVWKPEVSKQ